MTKIVGILNITPDSFSNDGLQSSPSSAIMRVNELFEWGADIIDIGAESTAYNATLLTHEQEWSRLECVLKNIPTKNISIDTYHHNTAKKCIGLGVDMINDVTGGKDDKMLELIAKNPHVKYIIMHNIKIPADRNFRIKSVSEIYDWAKANIQRCLDFGINKEQLIFDPGLGFTTYPKEAFEVIKNCQDLRALGVPSYIGHSRKSCFENVTNLAPEQRDLETTIASVYMYNKVDYLRVHNVEMHKRAFIVWSQLAS